jgi:hypothetical protein
MRRLRPFLSIPRFARRFAPLARAAFIGPAAARSLAGACVILSATLLPAAEPGQAEHGDHEHGVGANGGLIVPLGRESYHIEPVFEPHGVLRLYLLGADESRIQETQRQTLTAYVKPVGGRDTVPLEIESEPQEGDADGMTSRFKGLLPETLRGVEVEVTIPNLRIEGERFRVGFSSVRPDGHPEAKMPAAASDDQAAELFLTPGGKYTEADITANGRLTAKQKFSTFVAKHDMHPKAGDAICPITETKANPKCAWVIGGQTYEFCCPPCVEEFVRMAKESPDQIRDPGDYVQR